MRLCTLCGLHPINDGEESPCGNCRDRWRQYVEEDIEEEAVKDDGWQYLRDQRAELERDKCAQVDESKKHSEDNSQSSQDERTFWHKCKVCKGDGRIGPFTQFGKKVVCSACVGTGYSRFGSEKRYCQRLPWQVVVISLPADDSRPSDTDGPSVDEIADTKRIWNSRPVVLDKAAAEEKRKAERDRQNAAVGRALQDGG